MNIELNGAQIDPLKLFIEDFCQRKKLSLKDFLTKVELHLIIHSLNKTNGNQREAAKILGVKPTTLNEKLRRHHIGFRKSVIDNTKTS
jgi:transcriptional regulator with GAF, ATPase, and Fis domain